MYNDHRSARRGHWRNKPGTQGICFLHFAFHLYDSRPRTSVPPCSKTQALSSLVNSDVTLVLAHKEDSQIGSSIVVVVALRSKACVVVRADTV